MLTSFRGKYASARYHLTADTSNKRLAYLLRTHLFPSEYIDFKAGIIGIYLWNQLLRLKSLINRWEFFMWWNQWQGWLNHHWHSNLRGPIVRMVVYCLIHWVCGRLLLIDLLDLEAFTRVNRVPPAQILDQGMWAQDGIDIRHLLFNYTLDCFPRVIVTIIRAVWSKVLLIELRWRFPKERLRARSGQAGWSSIHQSAFIFVHKCRL